MYCKQRNGSVFLVTLAMGLGLLAMPSAAAPFAYVANTISNTVSVIDTTTSPPSVVATVPVGPNPIGAAVSPDGTHVYVANFGSNTVSVIDTLTTPPSVAATIVVGSAPFGVAVAPDGKHAYVTNKSSSTV